MHVAFDSLIAAVKSSSVLEVTFEFNLLQFTQKQDLSKEEKIVKLLERGYFRAKK